MDGTSTKPAPPLNDLRAQRDVILDLAARYGAYNLRVFGSVARGEAIAGSDVDLLADFHPHSLLQRIALMRELSVLIGCRVEVVQEKALKPHVKAQALKDAVPL